MPAGSAWSGFASKCSSYSSRIFCTTPKKLSSMTFSSFSEDLNDAVSDFSSVTVFSGSFTSAEVRLAVNFLGNPMVENFLPKRPFFFSSVGEVGVEMVPLVARSAAADVVPPGVSGTLTLSDEASDRFCVLLEAEK